MANVLTELEAGDALVQQVFASLSQGQHLDLAQMEQMQAEHPGRLDFDFFMGIAHLQQSQYELAWSFFSPLLTRASADMPWWPDLLRLSGFVALRLKRFGPAASLLSQARALLPDDVELARALLEAYINGGGKPKQILALAEWLLEDRPWDIFCLYQKASQLSLLGRWLDALTLLRQTALLPSMRLTSQIQSIHILQRVGLYASAQRRLQPLPRDEPEVVRAHALYHHLRAEYQEAMRYYSALLQREGGDRLAEYNLADCYFSLGQWPLGWEMYRRRFDALKMSTSYESDLPVWNGAASDDVVLLLHSEQGLGDILQCLRYLPLVQSKIKQVVFSSNPDVLELLRHDAQSEEVAIESVHPTHQAMMFDLPALTGCDLEEIAPVAPYLQANAEKVAYWREKIQSHGDFVLRVGLVWAGNPDHQNDHNRSARLADFAPLASVPGVGFFSLQKGGTEKQAGTAPAGMQLANLSADITCFADTAAILANLDLLISVDTSVAHLAGALGQAVWTLIPIRADWRWADQADTTAWYQSMRLFRSREQGAWGPTVLRMLPQLAEMARLKQGPYLADVALDAYTWLANLNEVSPDILLQSWLNLWAKHQGNAFIGNLLFACANDVASSCWQRVDVTSAQSDLHGALIAEAKNQIEPIVSLAQRLKNGVDTGHGSADLAVVCARVLVRQGQQDVVRPFLVWARDRWPEHLSLQYWHAQYFRQLGNWGQALLGYQTIVAVDPRWAEAVVNAAVCLHRQGNIELGLQMLQAAARTNTRHRPLWSHLFRYLYEIQRWPECCIVAEHMDVTFGRDPSVDFLWGVALAALGESERAEVLLQRALNCESPHDDVRIWLAKVLFDQGKTAAAEHVLAHLASSPNKSLLLGMRDLQAGRWAEGWRAYEARLQLPGRENLLSLGGGRARWDGLSLSPVVVFSEQGYGDTIQFARYLSQIPKESIVVVQDGLSKLLAANFSALAFVDRSDWLDQRSPDSYPGIELLSLPATLSMSAQPDGARYLWAQPELVNKFQQVLGADELKHQVKIGLVWAGSPKHIQDILRSCSIWDLMPLLREVQGVAWISLQKMEPAMQLAELPHELQVVDGAQWCNDWADTAALIENLDAVISVDTAVLHLAGAMGKKAWLLTREPAEWRWGLASDKTAWYDSVTLVRQKTPGCWADVVVELVEKIQNWLPRG